MIRKTTEYNEARRLRQEDGLSVKVIAKKLKVSSSTVSKWVKDIELSQLQRSNLDKMNPIAAKAFGAETLRKKEDFREKRAELQLKGKNRVKNSSDLFKIGCMLYWGEGAKNKNVVCICNTEVAMIKVFKSFLEKEFSVPQEDMVLRIRFHRQPEQTNEDVIAYWSEALGLGPDQIKVFEELKPGRKQGKWPYGVASLTVCSTEIVQQIFGAIQEIGGFETPQWLG